MDNTTTTSSAVMNAPITLDSGLSIRTSTSDKLGGLYEIAHKEEWEETKLPLLNPYAAFTKPSLNPIRRPEQNDNSIEATLHYQMAYRVQNHALDLNVANNNGDALLIRSDYHNSQAPTCLYVPRQISRSDLLKLLPERWITNYEKTQQKVKPIQSSEPKFIREKDGTVVIKFDRSHEKDAPTPSIFPTMFMMQPLPRRKKPDPLNRIIHSFDEQGQETYHFRDPATDHCYWDVCSSDICGCKDEHLSSDDESTKKKKRSGHKNLPDSDSDDDDDDQDTRPPKDDEADAAPLIKTDYGAWQFLIDQAPRIRPKKKPSKVLPCYRNILKWQKKNPSSEVILAQEDVLPTSCAQEAEKPISICPPSEIMMMGRPGELNFNIIIK
ncbi:hypothetical protein MLD38_029993 [Melastoma candidum]|uniref:Uncharacterized protein n=1 Tax=Melastoma candidum TaxID=119954 RepID=A0ACB9MKL6_9MYRT|nr:hypothetical protein MLD38_029993 [Melastoma candidum]